MSVPATPYYMVVIARIPAMSDSLARYSQQTSALLARHGGEYVVRGGPQAVLEGSWPDDRRVVVSRWPSLEALKGFWNSSEYQQVIKPLRAGTGDYDVTIFPAAQ